MRVRGEVRCYHCGHISGRVEGDPEDPPSRIIFFPPDGQPQRIPPSIRCRRCGGPVFLDELDRIDSPAPVAEVVARVEPTRWRRARPKPRWPGVA